MYSCWLLIFRRTPRFWQWNPIAGVMLVFPAASFFEAERGLSSIRSGDWSNTQTVMIYSVWHIHRLKAVEVSILLISDDKRMTRVLAGCCGLVPSVLPPFSTRWSNCWPKYWPRGIVSLVRNRSQLPAILEVEGEIRLAEYCGSSPGRLLIVGSQMA